MQETHLNIKDRNYLKVKDWIKIIQENGARKHAGVAIVISNKLAFKPKLVKIPLR